MLIISKYKDYYDFLQGIWGVDELRVLDRTKFETTPEEFKLGDKVTFIICGQVFQGVYNGKEWLYGEQLLPYVVESATRYQSRLSYYNRNDTENYHTVRFTDEIEATVLKNPMPDSNLKNIELDCPILRESSSIEWRKKEYEKHPILKDYNFGSALSPENMWLMLSDWLGKTKVIEDKQSDKEKIISAGFDLKASFRHRKS